MSLERFSHQLVSLSADGENFGGRFEWLATSAIVHLEISFGRAPAPDLGPLVRALGEIPLQALSLSKWHDKDSQSLTLQLSEYLSSAAARASLTELSITGFGFPSALRGLRLQKLAVDLRFCAAEQMREVHTLPDWISEMPLVELACTWASKLRTLPISLRSLPTLRFLDLSRTYIARTFDEDSSDQYDEAELAALEETGAVDDWITNKHIVTNVLWPLMSTNPQLVVRVLHYEFSDHAYELEETYHRGHGCWHRDNIGLLKGGGPDKLGVIMSMVKALHYSTSSITDHSP